MDENLKENIINNFEAFYMEHEDEMKNKDFFKTVSLYVASLYYDILDDLELNRESFGIDKDLTDCDAVMEIEDTITKTLIENEFNN